MWVDVAEQQMISRDCGRSVEHGLGGARNRVPHGAIADFYRGYGPRFYQIQLQGVTSAFHQGPALPSPRYQVQSSDGGKGTQRHMAETAWGSTWRGPVAVGSPFTVQRSTSGVKSQLL